MTPRHPVGLLGGDLEEIYDCVEDLLGFLQMYANSECVAVNLQHGYTLLTHCNKATHCNILQHTATHCSFEEM